MKQQLFVEERTYREHGYDHTDLVIRNGRVRPMEEMIGECTDNRIGYQDGPGYTGAETAARMLARYTWLREQGYPGIHAQDYIAAVCVTLTWQHFGTDGDSYCDCRIKLPSTLGSVQESTKVLNQLVANTARRDVKSWEMVEHPRHFMTTLRRMKAIAIERVSIPPEINQRAWNETELCILPGQSRLLLQAAS